MFLRTNGPCIEMTPAEAIRLRDVIDRALRVALAAGQDGGPTLMWLDAPAEPGTLPPG